MKDYGMAKDHNPKSKEIYNFISELDFKNGDVFWFKSGGDGDNGEFLMDLLDCYFESKRKDEHPIKLVYEGDPKIESIGDYDVTISRRLTLSEIAELFEVDEVDILDGKIGILTLEDNEEL